VTVEPGSNVYEARAIVVDGEERDRLHAIISAEAPSLRAFAATAPVRPALDADPGKPVISPTMSTEGTGATSTSTDSERSTRLPARLRSLLIAGVLADIGDSDPADLCNIGAGFTHGLLG
jgi:hypothetical protein